jgi:hypothetical protein
MRRMITLLAIVAGLNICSGLAAAPGGDVDVPFVFEHNEILVRVRIGGHEPVTMMLDTDSDPSSINLSFAQSNDFKLREIHGQVTGGGSERPKVYLTRLEGVELGSLQARDLQAVAIDLSKIQNRLGLQVQGVLGHDFLAGRVLQIDYPAKVLRFYRSSSALPSAKNVQAAFPFRVGEDGDILFDGVMINGKKAKATLDTGSDGMFALTPAAVETLGLTDAARQGQPDTSDGYKGTVQSTRGKIDRIGMGSMEVPSPEVVFWAKGAGRDQRPWDLDIGNAFLKDYIVTLDYQRKRITLQKP